MYRVIASLCASMLLSLLGASTSWAETLPAPSEVVASTQCPEVVSCDQFYNLTYDSKNDAVYAAFRPSTSTAYYTKLMYLPLGRLSEAKVVANLEFNSYVQDEIWFLESDSRGNTFVAGPTSFALLRQGSVVWHDTTTVGSIAGDPWIAGAALDEFGNLFMVIVGSDQTSRIVKASTEKGDVEHWFTLPNGYEPWEMRIGSDGSIYVIGWWYLGPQNYEPHLLKVVGERGAGNALSSWSLATITADFWGGRWDIDSQGTFFTVTGTHILEDTSKQNLTLHWLETNGGTGVLESKTVSGFVLAKSFDTSGYFAMDDHDFIYLSSWRGSNETPVDQDYVLKLNRQGKVVQQWRTGEGASPMKFDDSGDLIVGQGGATVWKIPNATAPSHFTTTGASASAAITDVSVRQVRTLSVVDDPDNPVDVVLTIPAGALAAPTTFTAVGTVVGGQARVSITAQSNGLAVTTFAKPITIAMEASASALPAISLDGVSWSNVETTTVSEAGALDVTDHAYTVRDLGDANIYTFHTRHLTSFGFRSEQENPVTLSASSSTVNVGKSVTTVTGGGPAGSSFTFSTSTPSICSISNSGVVRGLMEGDCIVQTVNQGDALYAPKASPEITVKVIAAPEPEVAPAPVVPSVLPVSQPTLIGEPVVGQKITCTAPQFSGNVSSYLVDLLLADGKPLAQASGASNSVSAVLDNVLIGQALYCQVVAVSDEGTSSIRTDSVVVGAAKPATTPVVKTAIKKGAVKPKMLTCVRTSAAKKGAKTITTTAKVCPSGYSKKK